MALPRERLLVLLLAHRAMLIGYITAIVREPHLAEDVFQNVALVVLKKGQQLTDETGFPIWARKVARLEAWNAVRKQRRGPEVLDAAVLDQLEAHWDATDDGPSDRAEALRRCLQRLTPRARQLIELRYVKNMGGRELAERVGRPLNTVYVALSRTYRALASCIEARLAREGGDHG